MAVVEQYVSNSLFEKPLRSTSRIARVEGDSATVLRLEGLGLAPGRSVHVERKGDPFIVRVYGCRVGLAPVLARSIHVDDL
jgi:Fe2+ transport system protein FeoA